MKPTAERRCRTVVAALPLLAALSACGGGGGAPVNSPSAVRPPPTPAPADPAPPVLDTPEYRRSTAAVASGVLSAWSLGWSGKGVIVGLVDSGIADDSPEFAGRIDSASRDVTGQNRSITDTSGHGTAVAAVLAAARNNGQIVGLAPEATIAAMRADSPGSCGGSDGCRYADSAIAAGIDASVAAGARAVNVSLGGGSASATLRNAISRATNAGVVVVISAGNDSQSQVDRLAQSFLSAGDPRLVIVAGGLAQDGSIADFSNRAGNAADQYVAAVAERVRSFNHEGDAFLYSGTSFATPQVTGAVALMAQAFPNLTGAQIVDLILSSAADLGAAGTDPVYGRGRLDLARAFAPKGPTALAGTRLAVSLNDNGSLGAAMGDGAKLGAALGQVPITDGYDREYQLRIGRTLRLAGNGRLHASLAGQPLVRHQQQWQVAGFDLGFGFGAEGVPAAHAARVAAADSHLGLAHRGMDIHAGSRNPVRETRFQVRRGPLALAAATGPGAGAVLPGHGGAGLVAADGLDGDPDPARQDRRLVMAKADLGTLRLALASASGTAALPPSPGLARQAELQHTIVAAEMPVAGALSLSARWTRLTEQGAFMGTRLSPAFGLHGGASDLLGGAIDLTPAPGWQLRVAAARGWHRPKTGSGLLSGHAGIGSTRWSASLAGPAPIGRWAARIAQPTAFDRGGFLVGADRRLVPVGVAARERVLELGWQQGALALTGYHRSNPGHRDAAADLGVALQFQHQF